MPELTLSPTDDPEKEMIEPPDEGSILPPSGALPKGKDPRDIYLTIGPGERREPSSPR